MMAVNIHVTENVFSISYLPHSMFTTTTWTPTILCPVSSQISLFYLVIPIVFVGFLIVQLHNFAEAV
jgi:hypothetical protein